MICFADTFILSKEIFKLLWILRDLNSIFSLVTRVMF